MTQRKMKKHTLQRFHLKISKKLWIHILNLINSPWGFTYPLKWLFSIWYGKIFPYRNVKSFLAIWFQNTLNHFCMCHFEMEYDLLRCPTKMYHSSRSTYQGKMEALCTRMSLSWKCRGLMHFSQKGIKRVLHCDAKASFRHLPHPHVWDLFWRR